MPDLTPADRIRRLAASLAAGEQPPPDDASWLADRLAKYLDAAPRGATLDLLLDLAPAPGREAWWRVEARARRDAAIRKMAAHFDGTASRKAELIAQHIERYAASAWRFDRREQEAPASYANTWRGAAFEVLQNSGGGTPSSRTIRRVLAAEDVGHEDAVLVANGAD